MLIHNGGPCIINHLMTGPKGNIEIEGKQNSLFPTGPVIMCFIIPPNSKLGSQIYSGFKEHDLITYKSKIHAVVSLGS